MKLGVAICPRESGPSICETARAVERAGLESLFVTEHTHLPVTRRDVQHSPHWDLAHMLDAFTALGAAAAVTSRVRLGTCVCVVAQHDPIILAKQVATIDHLSGGRFVFGVGAGWLGEEMRNHGVGPHFRWTLMQEKLLAMKAIWTHDEAAFHGRFVDFDPIMSWPKPVQTPYPPVLVGGSGRLSLRAAAGYGDGWMPLIGDVNSFERLLVEVRSLREEEGRPELEVTACCFELDERVFVRCQELGVARFVLWCSTDDPDDLESFLEGYARTGDQWSSRAAS